MSPGSVALGFVAVWIVASVIGGPLFMRAINRRLSWGISQRLRKGEKEVRLRIGYSGGVWNPARPVGPGNLTPNNPGRAIYHLSPDGNVNLTVLWDDGREEEFKGPLVDRPPHMQRVKKHTNAALGAYVVGASFGFGLGYLLSDSHNHGTRIQIAELSSAGCFILTWLSVSVVGRRVLRRPHDDD